MSKNETTPKRGRFVDRIRIRGQRDTNPDQARKPRRFVDCIRFASGNARA